MHILGFDTIKFHLVSFYFSSHHFYLQTIGQIFLSFFMRQPPDWLVVIRSYVTKLFSSLWVRCSDSEIVVWWQFKHSNLLIAERKRRGVFYLTFCFYLRSIQILFLFPRKYDLNSLLKNNKTFPFIICYSYACWMLFHNGSCEWNRWLPLEMLNFLFLLVVIVNQIKCFTTCF